MTIAGFDPSGGAGLLADIKTFERFRCQGFAVQTANTMQTEDQFVRPNWVPKDQLLEQLQLILQAHQFSWVKIGLIESIAVLKEVISSLQKQGRQKIIWDPVLRASAGYDFEHDLSALKAVATDCFLITPNRQEAEKIFGPAYEQEVMNLSHQCKVLVTSSGTDHLYQAGKCQRFRPRAGNYTEKHGSGCVLSSAITAHLALGYPMQKSMLRSKRYIERYLQSSPSLLGYHS